jgi:hypothetical protein
MLPAHTPQKRTPDEKPFAGIDKSPACQRLLKAKNRFIGIHARLALAYFFIYMKNKEKNCRWEKNIDVGK